MKSNIILALANQVSLENLTPETVVKVMKTNEFSSSTWEITPTIAKVLLKANVKNRIVRRSRVEQYKADLINGRWAQNGEAICFKKNGQLADGQHRLVAISESGVTVKMNVAVGCDDNGDRTYDSGLNRTNADAFRYFDIANYNTVSSIVNRYFVLKRRAPFISTREQKPGIGGGKIAHETKSALLEEYVNSASLYQEAYKTASRIYGTSRIFTKTEIGGLIVYLVKDMGYAYPFVEGFFDGLVTDGWNHNTAVACLRVRLMRAAVKKNAVMTRQHKQALLIKAWNLYAAGVSVRCLSYNEEKEGKIWFKGNSFLTNATI